MCFGGTSEYMFVCKWTNSTSVYFLCVYMCVCKTLSERLSDPWSMFHLISWNENSNLVIMEMSVWIVTKVAS